jgi:hypothetical protein
MNEVRIYADEATVRKLWKSQFKFDRILPAPCGEVPIQWFYDNWGCPRPPTDYECLLREPERLHVKFNTAWTPPLRFFEKLVRAMGTITSASISWCDDGGMSGDWRAVRIPGEEEPRFEATMRGEEIEGEHEYGMDWDWEVTA